VNTDKAKSLAEMLSVLCPGPLEEGQLGWFRETGEARDEHLERRGVLADYLGAGVPDKILFIGHPGSGKSTELVKFQEEHRDKWAFVGFSVVKEAQLSQVSVEALLILVVEVVQRTMKEWGCTLDEKTVKSVYEWFAETFEIREDQLAASLESGGGVDAQSTWWSKLLGVGAYMKADLKAGGSLLHRKVAKDRRRLGELAGRCHMLVREANLAVRKRFEGAREMVLIIEDLDKATIGAAEEVFIENPAPLAELPCRAIFTAPISLISNPLAARLDALFRRVQLPMIKVWERNGKPCEKGIETIKGILYERVEKGLVEDGAVEEAIKKTGGVLRHFFEVMVTATQKARGACEKGERGEERINEGDVRYGLDQLKQKLVRQLGPVGLPKKYDPYEVTVEKMIERLRFARLRELKGKQRQVESDPVNMLLLECHALLEYNGKGWHLVHPLVAEHLEEG